MTRGGRNDWLSCTIYYLLELQTWVGASICCSLIPSPKESHRNVLLQGFYISLLNQDIHRLSITANPREKQLLSCQYIIRWFHLNITHRTRHRDLKFSIIDQTTHGIRRRSEHNSNTQRLRLVRNQMPQMTSTNQTQNVSKLVLYILLHKSNAEGDAGPGLLGLGQFGRCVQGFDTRKSGRRWALGKCALFI